MKVHTEYLKFHTKTHRAYVHITPQVDEIVRKSGVKEGMVLVSAMHITAGVYVNDNESGLIEDIDQWLEHLAPFRKNYKHHETGEDNGDSHLKALLIHHEVIVPITAGKLDFGTWQRIFYAEFDGQRDKRVIVKVMGEGTAAGGERLVSVPAQLRFLSVGFRTMVVVERFTCLKNDESVRSGG